MPTVCERRRGIKNAGGVRENHRLRFACRVCLELGIDDPRAWLDSIDNEVFETWWAYYQCEPFGKHWEQVASIASTVSAVSAMVAATHGTKAESVGVLDFMPGDSLSWMKRKRRKAKGITSGAGQAAVIKHAFGFR